MPTIPMTSFRGRRCMESPEKKKGRFLCTVQSIHTKRPSSFILIFSCGDHLWRGTKQKRDAYSASFIRLKWFVSFHMRYLFINDRFKIWAIKKGPTFRMFFEKSAQNDQRDSSVLLGSLFCRIGIFLLQPQIVARKNPETVVVSGFSVSVSILVG